MAQPSTLTNTVRDRVTSLLDALYEVETILVLVEDTGATDATRKVFFELYLKDGGGAATTDITSDEFINAVVALRALRTWLVTNRPTLAKLRS